MFIISESETTLIVIFAKNLEIVKSTGKCKDQHTSICMTFSLIIIKSGTGQEVNCSNYR